MLGSILNRHQQNTNSFNTFFSDNHFLLACLQDPTVTDEQHVAISKLVVTERVQDAYWQIWALKGTITCTNISQVEIMGPHGPQLILGLRAVKQTLSVSAKLVYEGPCISILISTITSRMLASLAVVYQRRKFSKDCISVLWTQMNTFSYLLRPCTGQYWGQTLSCWSSTWRPFVLIGVRCKNPLPPPILDYILVIASQQQHPKYCSLPCQVYTISFMTGILLSWYQLGLQVILEKRQVLSMLIFSELYFWWRPTLMWPWRFF